MHEQRLAQRRSVPTPQVPPVVEHPMLWRSLRLEEAPRRHHKPAGWGTGIYADIGKGAQAHRLESAVMRGQHSLSRLRRRRNCGRVQCPSPLGRGLVPRRLSPLQVHVERHAGPVHRQFPSIEKHWQPDADDCLQYLPTRYAGTLADVGEFDARAVPSARERKSPPAVASANSLQFALVDNVQLGVAFRFAFHLVWIIVVVCFPTPRLTQEPTVPTRRRG
jgi:hypothetical protein